MLKKNKKNRHMTLALQYHEKLADKWSTKYRSGSFGRRRRFFQKILQTAVRRGSVWLDAGCGSGVFTRELAQLGATGLALDGSPEMIARAISEASDYGEVSFKYLQISSIEVLDDGDHAFDGVLCASVVEYLEKPDAALSEFYRVLKPGGALIVSVPCRHSIVRRSQKIIRRLGVLLGHDFFSYLAISKHDFSMREIRSKLEDLGYIIDGVDYFDPSLPEWVLKFIPGALLVVRARRKGQW
ncbi:methyltransferase domain-containing protein [Rhodobacterales bacterium FZCC0069]|nr:methyltransferase domain-containing protein [Rhodobacterales bacterium FZCC0069]